MSFALIAFIVAAVYLLYLFALVVWSHGKLPFGDAAATFALALYVIAAMSAIMYIRDFPLGGEYIYLLIFLGAWVTDTFAYFTGFLIGKHKLIIDIIWLDLQILSNERLMHAIDIHIESLAIELRRPHHIKDRMKLISSSRSEIKTILTIVRS